MKHLNLFIELTRLNKPIGYMLLFWPCIWGLTLSYDFNGEINTYIKYLIFFLLGSVLMRSAGCIVNDIFDKKFDQKVERTKNRPIASEKISIKLALVYVLILCFIAFLILLNFNLTTIFFALASMPLAFSYPLMKRFTYWPQLFLGITFNYGLLLAWISINNSLSLVPIIFYLGAIFWTLGYDTIYGYQDIKDDEIIGVKSTSIKFKNNPIIFVTLCYLVLIISIIIIGIIMKFNDIFFLSLVITFSHLFFYQIKNLDTNSPEKCLKIFKSNNIMGLIILVNIFLGKFFYLMNNRYILGRLYKDYTKKFLKKIFFAAIFSIIVAGSTSAIAWLLDPAIKKIFIEKDQTLIVIIPVFIIFAFSTKGISLYLAKILMIEVGEEIKKILQADMLKSFISADTQFIENKHTGKYISNLTYDVNMITNLLSNALLSLFKDSLTLIGLLTVMFVQNWKLSLVAMIMIPCASIAAKTLGKRIGKVATEAQEKSGLLNTYLIEIFKNHKLIKIFQNEKYENLRAEKFINELKDKSKKIAIVFVRAAPIMETLTGIMIAILIYYSGKLIMTDEIGINNFFSFLAAMMLAYQPVRALTTLHIGVNQGLSAAKRILPIIDNKNNIYDKEDNKILQLSKGNIKFKNVIFKYDSKKEHVLNSVNILIEGGKMTSLVGHSGAGKSTILNLIPRFYDSASGDIQIDEQSIYKTKISSLRKNISLVSQDITLFDDTVKNNISYANINAEEKDILEAAKLSFADEFINKLPNKYETIIGENGVRLSGGEKQRLSIARAILKKSQIVLLDEATSSLDAETESKIQKAINLLTKDRTTLVIAHRLSTILNSNKIYVIDNGSVVGEGKHEELINNSKIYKNFYEKQIQKN